MNIALIAAVAANGIIGDAGRIPWHLSDDLKRFKRLTLGHPIIMGRKTYESLGKPLPGRTNIVLTRNQSFTAPPEVLVFPDLTAALADCRRRGAAQIFIIGGAAVYRAALPLANRLLLTRLKRTVTGDTAFPDVNFDDWTEVAREEHAAYAFVDYDRRRA